MLGADGNSIPFVFELSHMDDLDDEGKKKY